MSPTFARLFRAPYSVPNGLQVTEEGLWIADQITDRVALIELTDTNDYGVTKLIRDIPTESSNTSGLTYGDGSLWLAANGAASLWRPARPWDAAPHDGAILRVDPATGQTQARYPLPGGGGTHGIEYDHLDPGHLWLTTLQDQTLTKVRIADWSIQHVIPLPLRRAHGVVQEADGLWVVFTADRVILKLSPQDGAELDRIQVTDEWPEPHGLSAFDSHLLFCDATSGWVTQISFT